MPPPSYRGCWHGVSRGFFLESCHDRALDERALQAALPFFTHAILLDRAFAHCPRFPTAAPRGSPGRVSVPVWLIIRKDQLSIIGLLPENNVRLACVKHIASVPSEPGSNSSFDYDLALQCLVIDILEKLVKSRQTLSKAMVARNGFSQIVFRLWIGEARQLLAAGEEREEAYTVEVKQRPSLRAKRGKLALIDVGLPKAYKRLLSQISLKVWATAVSTTEEGAPSPASIHATLLDKTKTGKVYLLSLSEWGDAGQVYLIKKGIVEP
ncbi:hypothetical protein Tco_1483242 [Tanacetum coccineum]